MRRMSMLCLFLGAVAIVLCAVSEAPAAWVPGGSYEYTTRPASIGTYGAPNLILNVRDSNAGSNVLIGSNKVTGSQIAVIKAGGGETLNLGSDGKNARLTVHRHGNIGIGTTSPGYKLDVIGDRIRLMDSLYLGATEIMLRTDGTHADLGVENADLYIGASGYQSGTAVGNIILKPHNWSSPGSGQVKIEGGALLIKSGTNWTEAIEPGYAGFWTGGSYNLFAYHPTGAPNIYTQLTPYITLPNLHGTFSLPGAMSGRAGIFANGATASDTNLYSVDALGNIKGLSPHDPETGDWIFYSKNIKTGRVVRVNMERMIHKLEELTGETFLEETFEHPEYLGYNMNDEKAAALGLIPAEAVAGKSDSKTLTDLE